MRILLAGAAAAFAFAATPALAQYGGSPQEQVEGAAGADEAAAPQDDEEVMAQDADGEDYALADIDADGDGDVDADVDADLDADAGDIAGKAQAVGDEAGEVGEPDEIAPPEQGATWQSEDGRAYCRRSDGTTGLVVGGGAGALVGRGIDGGRNRGVGTVIGAIAGALIGSAVERSASEQSCR